MATLIWHRRLFSFKRDKLSDEKRMQLILHYLSHKITERYNETLVGRFLVSIYDQDGDNFLQNKATLAIDFETIEISK